MYLQIGVFLRKITELHKVLSDTITFPHLLLFHGNSCIKSKHLHPLIKFQEPHVSLIVPGIALQRLS